MKGFDDIKLTWAGETYAVPAERQMELICRIEAGLIDGKNRQAYEVLFQSSGPPIALLSRVYADALIYAGAKVQPIDVFREFSKSVKENGDLYILASRDLLRVLGLLSNDEQAEEADSEKKPEATAT